MMCMRDGGRESSGGMCIACASLEANPAYRQRVVGAATLVDPMDPSINFKHLTREELVMRLHARHDQSRNAHKRENCAKQEARDSHILVAAAEARAASAVQESRTLMQGLIATSELATAAECTAVEAQMALAQAAQQHAEQQASAETSFRPWPSQWRQCVRRWRLNVKLQLCQRPRKPML